MIEETIRRNASPVRLDENAGQTGSCSSLASSTSDEPAPRVSRSTLHASASTGVNTFNVLIPSGNFASAGECYWRFLEGSNFMTFSLPGGNLSGKALRTVGPNGQVLLHSLSTNDASLGEYKYTVNVGPHNIKITGDCCDLVRVSDEASQRKGVENLKLSFRFLSF